MGDSTNDVPVYVCSLATLEGITGKRYGNADSRDFDRGTVREVNYTDFTNNRDYFKPSDLEAAITQCKRGLLDEARKIDPQAIVVEAKYVHFVPFGIQCGVHAMGLAVKDVTGQPRG